MSTCTVLICNDTQDWTDGLCPGCRNRLVVASGRILRIDSFGHPECPVCGEMCVHRVVGAICAGCAESEAAKTPLSVPEPRSLYREQQREVEQLESTDSRSDAAEARAIRLGYDE